MVGSPQDFIQTYAGSSGGGDAPLSSNSTPPPPQCSDAAGKKFNVLLEIPKIISSVQTESRFLFIISTIKAEDRDFFEIQKGIEYRLPLNQRLQSGGRPSTSSTSRPCWSSQSLAISSSRSRCSGGSCCGTRPTGLQCTSSGKKNKFGPFLVVLLLIHRLMQADIRCTTTAHLFFFPLLGYIITSKLLMI